MTTATITVVRTGPATGTATVSYSTSDGLGDGGAIGGTHYTPTSGTLTFGSLVTSKTFTVRVLPDRVVAGAKTVLLVLSNPTPGDTPARPAEQRDADDQQRGRRRHRSSWAPPPTRSTSRWRRRR